ncbi:pyrroline-5-carboxylate reductase [Peptoniphilus equinus]|uniref:Pyrroline-5-carboxylate reductase n=1 Tax=Peptoniphilus equinus TaxID=3016343 RepID=A0ABY7QVD7_9FIRM|nr:pyrroline-5-carboxylate reductase [Peptoniphilus equinus]WBW50005.1 pyrroline-5-carboxylate reductase [Peptoniphilus equinus]
MKVGILGVGNMGGAIARSLMTRDDIELYLSNKDKDLSQYVGANVVDVTGIAKVDYLFLGVKPHIYPVVAEELKGHLAPQTVVISIAAGMTFQKLAGMFPAQKLILSMPNTPAQVGYGMSAIAQNEYVTEAEFEIVRELFEGFGKVTELDEALFDAFSACAGAMPAFVYMFIEAAGDGAVLSGIKRNEAYEFVAASVRGAAEMVLQTGCHPGVLKDQVTSPGGTTIEGVRALEDGAFRSVVMDAVINACEKSKKMGEHA